MRYPFPIAAIAIAVLVACDGPTDPQVVAFERLQTVTAPFTPQVFVGNGQVSVQASFRTPCEPYDATATVSLEMGALRLVVQGDARGPCPMDIIGTFFYRATIADAPVGRYTIRAVHSYGDVRWPSDSFDFGTVTLP